MPLHAGIEEGIQIDTGHYHPAEIGDRAEVIQD
jgi:hypothetical protein